jgi:hypothetical protein
VPNSTHRTLSRREVAETHRGGTQLQPSTRTGADGAETHRPTQPQLTSAGATAGVRVRSALTRGLDQGHRESEGLRCSGSARLLEHQEIPYAGQVEDSADGRRAVDHADAKIVAPRALEQQMDAAGVEERRGAQVDHHALEPASGELVDLRGHQIDGVEVELAVRHHRSTVAVGLHLDSYQGALAGSKNGTVLFPGDASSSELMRRVRGESQPRMPFLGYPLDADEIALLEYWIEAGLPEGETAAATKPMPAPALAEGSNK